MNMKTRQATDRRPWLGAAFAIACLIAASCLAITLYFAGTAVLFDQQGGVVSVVVTNDISQQPLFRLPGNVFVAIVDSEGEFEMRCTDGSWVRGGYVTRHLNTWERTKKSWRCPPRRRASS